MVMRRSPGVKPLSGLLPVLAVAVRGQIGRRRGGCWRWSRLVVLGGGCLLRRLCRILAALGRGGGCEGVSGDAAADDQRPEIRPAPGYRRHLLEGDVGQGFAERDDGWRFQRPFREAGALRGGRFGLSYRRRVA